MEYLQVGVGAPLKPVLNLANIVARIRRIYLVLNWANFCFANIVRSIRPTAIKLYSGSKKLRSTCSGNIRPIRRTLPLTG